MLTCATEQLNLTKGHVAGICPRACNFHVEFWHMADMCSPLTKRHVEAICPRACNFHMEFSICLPYAKFQVEITCPRAYACQIPYGSHMS